VYGFDVVTRLPPQDLLAEFVSAKDAARARAHADAARQASSTLADALRTRASAPGGRYGAAVAAVVRGARAEMEKASGLVCWIDPGTGRKVNIHSDDDLNKICHGVNAKCIGSPLICGLVAAAQFALGKHHCVSWTVPRREVLAPGIPGFFSVVHALAQDGWHVESGSDDDDSLCWVASDRLADRELHIILNAAAAIGIEPARDGLRCASPAGIVTESQYPRSHAAVAKRTRLVAWQVGRTFTRLGMLKRRRLHRASYSSICRTVSTTPKRS
jgi:hypothetical protein